MTPQLFPSFFHLFLKGTPSPSAVSWWELGSRGLGNQDVGPGSASAPASWADLHEPFHGSESSRSPGRGHWFTCLPASCEPAGLRGRCAPCGLGSSGRAGLTASLGQAPLSDRLAVAVTDMENLPESREHGSGGRSVRDRPRPRPRVGQRSFASPASTEGPGRWSVFPQLSCSGPTRGRGLCFFGLIREKPKWG